MRSRTVACVLGTRPEAIKMAPVIRALRRRPWADCRVIHTGQHRDLASPILDFFGIAPDVSLDAMRPGQSLADLTARLLSELHAVLDRDRPDLVLAQGDTTSVLCTALATFYLKIPFGHVEAGLRTGSIASPFPEEANRRMAGLMGAWHFAPTKSAGMNLRREGVAADRIVVTGNTVIDALRFAERRDVPLGLEVPSGAPLALVTSHRRDNHGLPLQGICRGIRRLIRRFPDLHVLWPLHPHPAVRNEVVGAMGGIARVHLCEPLGYGAFVTAMRRSTVILTDSGGVQEEAPALGTPVLVLRAESERPEGIVGGSARLVGCDPDAIVEETSRLLMDPLARRSMIPVACPYGDGRAARRIVRALERRVFAEDRPPTTLSAARAG
jgi:UDP-N-acetylglucosamine 2-epimerase (non-hydrolysing)